MRREQDSLNPRTHANIMVLSPEDDPSAHPYWYARIIGIYHTLVRHESSPDLYAWICFGFAGMVLILIIAGSLVGKGEDYPV